MIGGDKAVGLVIGGIDQAGSQVLFDQAQATGAKACGWRIEGVKKASVALCDIGHSDCRVGMRVAGGPGPVVILSGASSNNDLSYEIADGARLLARDIWYETNSKPRFSASPAAFPVTSPCMAPRSPILARPASPAGRSTVSAAG